MSKKKFKQVKLSEFCNFGFGVGVDDLTEPNHESAKKEFTMTKPELHQQLSKWREGVELLSSDSDCGIFKAPSSTGSAKLTRSLLKEQPSLSRELFGSITLKSDDNVPQKKDNTTSISRKLFGSKR